MITQTVTVNEKNTQNIIIGRRGTYNTEEIVFDMTALVEAFGSGSAVLMIKRPMDSTAYPAVTEQDGSTLTWTVSETDTSYKGHGECELFWYVDGGLAKSVIWSLTILRDIGTTTEEPPEPYESWVESLTALGAETLQNAQDAAQSASEAEQSATGAGEAKNAAELAADRAEDVLEEFTTPTASATTLAPESVATASYSNGHFTFGIPKGDKGDPGDPATNLVTSVNGKTGAVVLNATDVGAYVKPSGGIPKSDLASSVQTSLGKADTALQSAPVTSVNNKTGAVVLSASDVGAKPASYEAPVSSVNEKTGAVVLDAGDIGYESTTVEDELGTINSALSSLSAVTEIIDTASGAIASFPDSGGLPMRSLLAQIEPVQDLHGYDAPWAGGAGANKWDEQWELGGINSNGEKYTSSDRIRSKNYIPVTSGATYYTNTRIAYFEYDANKTFLRAGSSGSFVGPDVTITISSDAYYILFMCTTTYGTTYLNNIAINYPATVTTYAPYSNVCPITGWTGLSGERDGKNLLNPDSSAWVDGKNIDASGQIIDSTSARYYRNFLKCNGGESISFQYTQTTSAAGVTCAACFYDAGMGFIERKAFFSYGETKVGLNSGTVTAPSNARYFTVIMQRNLQYTSNVQCEFSSTPTDYEAYTSLPITVSWQTEAGTVYGGTVDVVTGVLTVDWKTVTIDGTGGNGASLNNNIRVRYPIPDDSVVWSDASTKSGYVICDMFPEGTNAESGTGTVCFHLRANGSHEVVFGFGSSFPGVSTLAEAMEWITANKPVVCYKLAESVVYQLTGQQISTLLGNNTVFVDCGSVSVTYQASIKGYIDKVLAS